MADISAIATEFTKYYYGVFDTDRSLLGTLYRPESMLTWEGTQRRGVTDILEKLTSLPFTKVVHQVTTVDAQPSSLTVASLLVNVMGFLKIDEGEHPLQFSQVFQLIPDGGSYYVLNDIFRLNLG